MTDKEKFEIICDNIKKYKTSAVIDYEDSEKEIADNVLYYYRPVFLSDNCIFLMDEGYPVGSICMVSDIRSGEEYPTFGVWYPEVIPINNTTINDVINFIVKNNWTKLLEGIEE